MASLALASAVEAFRASGATPATTSAVLSATRGLLPEEGQGSGEGGAGGEEAIANASKKTPPIAISSLVRALGEDLTSSDDARRAGSTQLLAQVRC